MVKYSKEQIVLLKIRAVEMHEEGMSNSEIRQSLKIGNTTVHSWLQIYAKHGLSALMSSKPKGVVPKLTKTQVAEIVQRIKSDRDKGIVWTSKKLRTFISLEYKVIYSRSYMNVLLKKHHIKLESEKQGSKHLHQVHAIIMSYDATEYGFPDPFWTTQRVTEITHSLFHVEYSSKHIKAYLYEHGWSFRRHRRQLRAKLKAVE